jgi:hypothetical protein
MEYRLDLRGVHLLGGAVLALGQVLAKFAPGAAELRFSLAAAFALYIWVRGLLYVRHARWGVRGAALEFCTGRLLAVRRVLPLGHVDAAHLVRLPFGVCFLTVQSGLAVCVIPFVRRADAEGFLAGWQEKTS